VGNVTNCVTIYYSQWHDMY